MILLNRVFFIISILSISFAVTGCLKNDQVEPSLAQIRSVKLSEKYTSVKNAKIDGIGFDFQVVPEATDFPKNFTQNYININKTLSANLISSSAEDYEKIRKLLESLRNGRHYVIKSSLSGRVKEIQLVGKNLYIYKNKYNDSPKIKYELHLSSRMNILKYSKEYSFTKKYLQEKNFSKDKILSSYVFDLGKPHFSYTEKNSRGVHNAYIWGIDENAFESVGGYDYYLLVDYVKFRDRYVALNVNNYNDGDKLVTITLFNNKERLRNSGT